MAKPLIQISIRTYTDSEKETFGRQFIEKLCQEPLLVPELVSTSERYKDAFLGIDHFVANWWAMPVKMYEDGRYIGGRFNGPFWKRKSRLASRGYIDHGLINVDYEKNPSTIWYECRWSKEVNYDRLFDQWVTLFQPDVAMLHLFTEPEMRKPQTEDERDFELGVFGGPFHPGLPNIGWAMAYGKSYAREVDVDRIRAAGFPVDVRDGISIVRVTEKLSDVIDNFAHFSQSRAKLKALFRPSLFWIKEEPGIDSK